MAVYLGTNEVNFRGGRPSEVTSVNGETGDVILDIPEKTSDLINDSGFISAEIDPTVPAWAKAQSKPTYTASEVGALPDSVVIPSKTSDLTNDSGFLTDYTETDPTVPSWAKAATKPTYTASEVGALSGNAGGLFYGTCSTAAGTVAKVVECADFTADNLKAGAIIIVTFTATNSGAIANLKLDVNSTGAKPLKYINNGSLSNIPSAGYLKANVEYPFYFDGANWVVWMNYNTTYSALSEADMEAGTATTARTITAQRLKQAVQYHAPKELPTVTTTDEGKFLRVNSGGVWAAEAVASAESEAY